MQRPLWLCLALLAAALQGCVSQETTLDAWLGSELDRLGQQAETIHAENAQERRQAFARTGREVFVVVLTADDATPAWQREDLAGRIAADLVAQNKRRVAAGAELQRLIDAAVAQSSDFFASDAGVPFGNFTPAQVFVHATIRQSHSPTLPTPDDVSPRGSYRFRISDYTVAAWDIETAEILLETSFQTLSLSGPGD